MRTNKLFLKWSFILFSGILFYSCEAPIVSENDEYYVKYVVESQVTGIIANRYAQFYLEDSTLIEFTFNASLWETTIGPVKKGFNAKLKAGFTSTDVKSIINTKISISKNNGPFALKKYDVSTSNRNLSETSYVIDF